METSKGSGCGPLAFIPVVIIVGVGAILWFTIFGPQMRHDRLEKEGIKMEGIIVNAEESGTVINDHPELDITVAIRRPNGTVDTATTAFVPSITTAALMQPGTPVKVAVDSADPQEFTILEVGRVGPHPSVTPGVPATDSLNAVIQRLQDSLHSIRNRVGQK